MMVITDGAYNTKYIWQPVYRRRGSTAAAASLSGSADGPKGPGTRAPAGGFSCPTPFELLHDTFAAGPSRQSAAEAGYVAGLLRSVRGTAGRADFPREAARGVGARLSFSDGSGRGRLLRSFTPSASRSNLRISSSVHPRCFSRYRTMRAAETPLLKARGVGAERIDSRADGSPGTARARLGAHLEELLDLPGVARPSQAGGHARELLAAHPGLRLTRARDQLEVFSFASLNRDPRGEAVGEGSKCSFRFTGHWSPRSRRRSILGSWSSSLTSLTLRSPTAERVLADRRVSGAEGPDLILGDLNALAGFVQRAQADDAAWVRAFTRDVGLRLFAILVGYAER